MSGPPKDPVVHSSLSKPLAISAALLVLALAWGLYDETYSIRPWKRYQARFAKLYARVLDQASRGQAEVEREIQASAEYRKLDTALEQAERAAQPAAAAIDRRIKQEVAPKLAALNEPFQEARSRIAALTYQLETAQSESAKAALRTEIELYKAESHFAAMTAQFQALKDEKARLLQQRIAVMSEAAALRARRDRYLADRIPGVATTAIAALRNSLSNFDIKIRQIHVKEADLVDRCESCHLGTREPLTLTKASMGDEAVFASHPNAELLKLHDPEKFGCTPCHGGNGVAVASVEKAHGENKFWLWPLHRKENREAGCQQCHARELLTELAPTLNTGREIYRARGCIACHRYEAFDREADENASVTQQLRQIAQQKIAWNREAAQSEAQANDPRTTDDDARKLLAHINDLKLRASLLDAQVDQLDSRSRSLVREVKKTGPSLKETRAKLRREWIPVWLKDPHQWREGTKMPSFRLADDEIRAIGAFVWQAAIPSAAPAQKPGDAARGKEALETRGCLACHSMGEGAAKRGGTFAANLSRVGEKANYDYLVRWVHNPRQRSAPYCAFEKRDLSAEDYRRHNLPFLFDLAHSQCPNDGHELQVQQMTPMPSLRLSEDEARDIASYLMTRKHDRVAYADAAYLEDPALRPKGMALVRQYGCANCHEIAGLEEELRIGTELSREGSKPVDRLDFALLTGKANAEGWLTHKGFFEHKLENPAIFDTGKEKAAQERLKMPNFHLSKPEIDAVTTFLLGSVDATVPPRYFYTPADRRQDITEGWWVVAKYNCMGCHQLHPGQASVLQTLPDYQDTDGREQLPPTLIGEGARVNPAWLLRFLANPALSETETNRNGVRGYLRARMPSFSLSEGEVRKLARFFAALSAQPEPFVAATLEPLTEAERTMARQLFTSEGAPCLKCHMTGDAKHDLRATAPNFTVARERLQPAWVRRWMLDPALMAPGTAMPSGLFRPDGERWVFAGPTPPSFAAYPKDHADLLVRYMFQFTPEELTRLRGSARK